MRAIIEWLIVKRWVEPAFAIFILLGIVRCAIYLYQNSYLPPPFFYEPSDTYADWFNTAFWSRDIGTYDVWRTLYPPLSFVVTRVLGIDSCYPDRRSYDFSAGLAARDCDWVGLGFIWVFFLLNLVLVWKVFKRTDRSTAIPRTICLGLGLPMLDALERGNLVLIAFACLLLGTGPLLKSARLRWLAIGLAVNFKVYLIAAIAPLVVKRRWRWVEGALLSVVLVYLASFTLLGRGTPVEIYENIRDFSTMPAAQITDQWYTITYQPLLSLITEGTFPLNLLIGSRNVDLIALVLPLLRHIVQASIVVALMVTMLRPETIPAYRVINLGILLALITSEAGGYTMICFMLFTLMEQWHGIARRWAIFMCYLLALPLDVIMDKTFPLPRDTYFGDRATMISFYVTIGPFLRPLIIMTIALALSLLTIHTVMKNLSYQLTGKRWQSPFEFLKAPLRKPPQQPVG